MNALVQRDHPLVETDEFATIEECAIYVMHRNAYKHASVLCEGRTVLDWGCNNGYGIPLLATTALRVGGIDTNELCITQARNRYPEYQNDIWLFDGTHIPFSERDWGAVVSFEVIEHIADMSAYLGAICSVLGEDGIALFTTPNRQIRLDPEMKPWNEFHVTEFSAQQLKSVLQQYFTHVQVLGLQGDPELMDIERNRCARFRTAARNDRKIQQRVRRSLRNVLRIVLPSGIVARLRNSRHTAPSNEKKAPLLASVVERLSDLQLGYTANEVETAVDFMAVCSGVKSNPPQVN
jgi:2-polyprenyl-3-methyl-5-hydroxy-6-metoxy-1,4-benzoquinol methylase